MKMYFTNTLQTQNNSLSVTGDFRTNEKTVNDIYLQTMAVGNNTFSEVQLVSLQAIAAQCPLSGGEAVLRARDMLALSQDSPIFYDDATICGSALRQPSQDRTGQVLESDFVQVRPNPASESITINYSLSDGLEHKLVLMNTIGEIVTNFLLNGKAGETTHSIGNLPPGIYWYTVIGGNGSETSGKLIINR
jgi:Secretion system C-terminal sorting domain